MSALEVVYDDALYKSTFTLLYLFLLAWIVHVQIQQWSAVIRQSLDVVPTVIRSLLDLMERDALVRFVAYVSSNLVLVTYSLRPVQLNFILLTSGNKRTSEYFVKK